MFISPSLSTLGSIFHVQVNALENLQHALLYSIQVELPAHRLGQLDRVLVLASPLNDMAIHAWDLNRVQRFFQLDIGIRLEMCPSCLRSGQERSITFVMDQRFIGACIRFLCQEAHIDSWPINENGFTVYNVPHRCCCASDGPAKNRKPPPPPYQTEERDVTKHEYDYPDNVGVQSEAMAKKRSSSSERNDSMSMSSSYAMLQPYFQFPEEVWEDFTGSKESGEPSTSAPASMTEAESTLVSLSAPTNLPSEVVQKSENHPSLSTTSSVSSLGESLFLADGILSTFDTAGGKGTAILAKGTQGPTADVPPRNIPRAGVATTTRLSSSSNLHYYNFQPRIQPQHQDVLLRSIPVPPRGLRPPGKESQEPSSAGSNRFWRPLPTRMMTNLPEEQHEASSLTALSSDEAEYVNMLGSPTDLSTQRNLQESSERESHRSSGTKLQLSSTTKRSEDLASPSSNTQINRTADNSGESDDNDEPDYEYMSNFSIRQQLNSTLSFSLAALNLNSSQDKKCNSFNRANVMPGQSNHSSKSSEADRAYGPLQRTFSDSSLDLCFTESSLKKPSPLEHRLSQTCASVSSVSSFEEDCYVMIPPATHRSSSERCISPSYIREAQLLDKIAPKMDVNQMTSSFEAATILLENPGHKDINQSEVFPTAKKKEEPKEERKISLTDAGQVIRENWVTTLEELRKEHAKITRQVQEVVRAQTGVEKLDLNEVAYLDWKRKEKTLSLMESLGSSTDDVFPQLVSDSNGGEKNSEEESDYSDFMKVHCMKHSKSDPSTQDFKLHFLPRSRPNLTKRQTIPRSSAVVNKAPISKLKDRNSSGYVRSTSLPKRKMNLLDGGASNSNFTATGAVGNTLPSACKQLGVSRSPVRRKSSTESEEDDLEYVHEFINIASQSRPRPRPVPLPRSKPPQQQKFDGSQQASMVTLGIFRDASSPEGNLLKALEKSNSTVPSSLLSRGLSATANTIL